MNTLNTGDRIAITKGPNITHYGIYAGNNTVIDNSNAKGGVNERPLCEFAGGRKIRRIQLTAKFPPHEVVARARQQIGKPYGWFSQNCEHFVNEVQLDNPKSTQAVIGGSIIAIVFWRLFVKR